ncbi:MAG: cytidylate kinase [Benjaminiella poitrasii]|nr:MAG: cytidylate kinase [Benjaminiella poitrasii]
MMSRLFRIAIDGPAASGKSTTAKLLAEKLGFGYIDSGAMFRAVTLKCQLKNIDPNDISQQDKVTEIAKSCRIRFPALGKVELDGEDVSELIRTSNITRNISIIASNPAVRNILANQQRAMAKGDIEGIDSTGFEKEGKGVIKGVVMDGRDIGTVILPDAELKVFIVADVEIRAKRRFDELKRRQGEALKDTLDIIKNDLEARDLADRTRKVAPLLQAKDAVLLDTSHLTIEQQAKAIEDMIYERT